jgi:hypothetical protein
LGISSAIEPLVRSLAYCNGTGVGTIYGSLSLFPDITTKLISYVSHGDDELKLGASYAIGWFIEWGRQEQNLEFILAGIVSPLVYCRVNALKAIGNIGNKDTLVLLEHIIQTDNTSKQHLGKTPKEAALAAIESIQLRLAQQ